MVLTLSSDSENLKFWGDNMNYPELCLRISEDSENSDVMGRDHENI